MVEILQKVDVRRPNGSLAKLQAAPHANSDAARCLPRLESCRQERFASDVTPSHARAQGLQLRATVSAACQLQLIVRARRGKLEHRAFGLASALLRANVGDRG
jgi:hypothetical protein